MEKSRVKEDIQERNDIALTPLAIPMLAGPGSISLLITLNQTYTKSIEIITAILAVTAVCIVVYVMLKFAHFIVKFLGASGINAISRIIGFIVIAIGIEYISTSILSLLSSLK